LGHKSHQAALLNANDRNGNLLVSNCVVAGFSNTKKAAVKLTEVAPFLIEGALKRQGGNDPKGDDWAPLSVQDGLLVTGQKPASSEQTTPKVLHHLDR